MSTLKKFNGRQGYHRAKHVSTLKKDLWQTRLSQSKSVSKSKKFYGRQGYHGAKLVSTLKNFFMGDRVIIEQSLCQHLKSFMGERVITEQSLCQH